jgi:hypothetical protein
MWKRALLAKVRPLYQLQPDSIEKKLGTLTTGTAVYLKLVKVELAYAPDCRLWGLKRGARAT